MVRAQLIDYIQRSNITRQLSQRDIEADLDVVILILLNSIISLHYRSLSIIFMNNITNKRANKEKRKSEENHIHSGVI